MNASSSGDNPQPTALIEAVGLRKSYGELHAVDNLSFRVQKGEILGISGPNGAGKTTLFDLVSGISALSDGQIRLSGEDLSRLSADAICRRGVARTFQMNAGFDGLTLEQNVLVGASFGNAECRSRASIFISKATRRRAREALDFVGLGHRRNLLAGDANVFERKLTMIAGAIATEPQILLMDEPAGGLVPEEIDQLATLVQSVKKRGITLIIIEHIMRFLTALSDRMLVMHHGALLFEGTPEAMFEDEQVAEVYLGSLARKKSQPDS